MQSYSVRQGYEFNAPYGCSNFLHAEDSNQIADHEMELFEFLRLAECD